MPLKEAVEAAIKVYEKERRHAAPIDAVAQHIGYKSANNGTAIKALASLRYFGLMERLQDGLMAVTKDLESFQFAPSAQVRAEIVHRWLKAPPVFAELLEKYPTGLPSDATLKYELIQRGFLPDAAESVLAVFRTSVEFARHYEPVDPETPRVEENNPTLKEEAPPGAESDESSRPATLNQGVSNVDRIPVRLLGGRRAWLEIPMPFYEADKQRLKSQIDLLLTEEDENDKA
jgi:hypothetical protein